jgi:uncharacterized C2H2 Zn-finger protein
MHSIDTPPSATDFEERLTCPTCGTSFTAETADLKVGRFKKPGTSWFDGSADDAGLDTRFFVDCPHGCDIVFTQGEIPPLVRADLLAQAGIPA